MFVIVHVQYVCLLTKVKTVYVGGSAKFNDATVNVEYSD